MTFNGLDALVRNVRAKWLSEASMGGGARWSVAGTSFTYREIDGIADLAVEGVFSHTISRAVRTDVLRCLGESDILGLLVDLRRSLVVLDEDSLDLTMPRQPMLPVHQKPVALVVTAELEQLALQWMWEMTAAGLARRTFVDPVEARHWVLDRVHRR